MASPEAADNTTEAGANSVNLTDPVELLVALRDIYLPEPVSAWPPSPLIWVMLAILLLLVTIGIHYIRHNRRNTDPLFHARSQLDSSYAQWKKTGSTTQYLEQSGVILKRVAIQFAGRDATARLNGQQWVQWLNNSSDVMLPDTVQTALQHERYKKAPAADIAELHSALAQWLKHYRRDLHA